MLVFVFVMVVALLAVAVVYDLISRRRGTYRTSKEWLDMSRRRRSHFRRSQFRRDRAGETQSKPER